eukprot:193270-Pleurochrysis_carterae.AAC.1
MYAPDRLACQFVGQEIQLRVDDATHGSHSSTARYHSCKTLVRSAGWVRAKRKQARNVRGSAHVIPPETGGQTRGSQHYASIPRQRAPLSFACAVLSRHVWRYCSKSHARIGKQPAYGSGREIAGVVRVEALDDDAVSIAIRQILFDCVNCVRFGLEQV